MKDGKYEQHELDHIGKIRPEFKVIKPPTLDQVIVSFLAKYDVFVEPVTSTNTKGNKNLGDASIAILGGPELGYDAVKVRKQKEQTKIQEWTQWKQWALDHKDFEAYRSELTNQTQERYFETLKKLEDPKIQEELQPIMDAYNKKIETEFNQNIWLLSICGFIILLAFVVSASS